MTTPRPVIPMLDASLWVNDSTTTVARLIPDGSDRATVKLANEGQRVGVYGNRDTLRRLLRALVEQLDAAEAAHQAEELNRMDAERDRVDVEDAAYEDAHVAGADPTYGRGV